MRQAETRGHVPGQRLHAVALRGVMACGNEGDSRFTRKVDLRLGYLAGDIDVDVQPDGLFYVDLRTAGAPRRTLEPSFGIPDDQWRANQCGADPRTEFGQGHGCVNPRVTDQYKVDGASFHDRDR